MPAKAPPTAPASSFQSRAGLDAVNFFQAESVGVVLPVLDGFLRDAHWRYDSIGIATAVAGLGTFLFQTPAGVLTDRIRQRRALFAITSLIVGACFAAIPMVPRRAGWIDPLLFVSGVAQSFFIPLLGALALALVGHRALNRTLGENQGWNHAGNIAAAVLAIAVAHWLGSASVFYSVAFAAALAAVSVYFIRGDELHEDRASGQDREPVDNRERDAQQPLDRAHADDQGWRTLLRDRTVLGVILAVTLFHLANAPILPVTALYVKKLGGSDSLMTSTVLVAQVVMIPVAWLSGRLGDSWGRKPVLLIGFWALPLRILSYTFAHNAHTVVALQALDGVGAGIYGVISVALAADLTRGKGKFNSLMGIFATAQATGGVLGPIGSGFLIQHLGFRATFIAFALLAVAAALALLFLVPETRNSQPKLQPA